MLMPVTDGAGPLAARGPAEVDLELFAFVERYATNLLRWDLIMLFGRSPDSAWTAGEIATQLHRVVLATTKELDDLTYLHVLVRGYTPERTTYRLSKRANVRRAAMQLARLQGASPPPSPPA